ncbi:WxcM-like domain-containing protein [Algoriphagus kandeliae]|uniref:WxcM-like domain-containing protein n=1 Tax=Algoriphagus kandeliae TaxID=2562278 RepID=A0A4Y9R221_9BACT|nr:FdtA/QdtA family cupin domain-containing protein [Algoriphagus kandeliae]TFV97235.1 WxcM-like domain-containing protein [Algoriphagus kandeliae]
MNDSPVKIIEFPKISDPRGTLTFLQYPNQIPFEINRVFWTYDVPGGEIRGGHAYKSQSEVIIALSGSFDVVVMDKLGNKIKYTLNRSYYGLYIPPQNWRHMENFSTNALSLHISNKKFDESEYIRDISVFMENERL